MLSGRLLIGVNKSRTADVFRGIRGQLSQSSRMRCLLLVLLTTTWCWASPPLFQKLSFEKAQSLAASQKKWLLVDATATWCGPCKHMDRTTWIDKSVGEFCKKRIVAIQIDVDEQKALAKRLRIDAMPTVILFKGTKELDRSVGYKQPRELLAWFNQVAHGKKEIDRLAEQALKGDIQARMRWADSLLHEGRTELATQQYVWLWDHMLEKDPAMVGVRHSFFEGDLERLITAVPAARKSFAQRLAKLQSRVEKGESNRLVLADWISLSKVLDGGESALRYALKVQGTPQAQTLRAVEDDFYEMLVSRGQWAQAGRFLTDPVAQAKQELELEKDLVSELPPEMQERMKAYARESTSKDLLSIYRACLAAGKSAEAETVRKMILTRDSSDEMKAQVEAVEQAR